MTPLNYGQQNIRWRGHGTFACLRSVTLKIHRCLSFSKTVSAVTCLFLAMARYPRVLAKAQAELDSVVGSEHLPDFSHVDRLPYIHAITMELLRWQPVLPLGALSARVSLKLCLLCSVGFPHRSTADDEYRGYFIPKGTLVIANGW